MTRLGTLALLSIFAAQFACTKATQQTSQRNGAVPAAAVVEPPSSEKVEQKGDVTIVDASAVDEGGDFVPAHEPASISGTNLTAAIVVTEELTVTNGALRRGPKQELPLAGGRRALQLPPRPHIVTVGEYGALIPPPLAGAPLMLVINRASTVALRLFAAVERDPVLAAQIANGTFDYPGLFALGAVLARLAHTGQLTDVLVATAARGLLATTDQLTAAFAARGVSVADLAAAKGKAVRIALAPSAVEPALAAGTYDARRFAGRANASLRAALSASSVTTEGDVDAAVATLRTLAGAPATAAAILPAVAEWVYLGQLDRLAAAGVGADVQLAQDVGGALRARLATMSSADLIASLASVGDASAASTGPKTAAEEFVGAVLVAQSAGDRGAIAALASAAIGGAGSDPQVPAGDTTPVAPTGATGATGPTGDTTEPVTGPVAPTGSGSDPGATTGPEPVNGGGGNTDSISSDGNGSADGTDDGGGPPAAAPPVVTGIYAQTPQGSYRIGATITFRVVFDQPITYTLGAGFARLELRVASDITYFVHATDWTTNSLVFTHVAGVADNIDPLEYASVDALTLLADTTITGATGVAANLHLPPVGSPQSLGYAGHYRLDNNAPSGLNDLTLTPHANRISGAAVFQGDTDGMLVMRNDATDVIWSPVFGTAYAAGEVMNDGSVVAYSGSLTAFDDQPLDSAILYHYKVYTFDKALNYGSGLERNAQPDAAESKRVSFRAGGPVDDVVRNGNYVYASKGRVGIDVIDVTSSLTPTFVKNVYLDDHDVVALAVNDNRLLAATDRGLAVLNIGTPSNPTLDGFYATGLPVTDVVVDGMTAYITTANNMLMIDLNDPTNPSLVYSYQSPANVSANGIALGLGRAYLAMGTAGIDVVDVSSAMGPSRMGGVATTNALKIAASGSWVYVADAQAGLTVIDAALGDAPAIEAQLPGFMGRDVNFDGTTLLLGGATDGLKFVSVVSHETPTLFASSLATGHNDASGAVFTPGAVMLANGRYGLQTLNTGNPIAPVLTMEFPTIARAGLSSLADGLLYVADGENGVGVIDVSTQKIVGRIETTDARDVVVRGNKIYVADGASGVRVFTKPNGGLPSIEDAHVGVGGSAASVALDVTNNYVIVCVPTVGVKIVDVSSSTTPVLSQSIDESGCQDAIFRNNTALITNVTGLVSYGSLASGLTPNKILQLPTGTGSNLHLALSAAGTHALIACDAGGFKAVELAPGGVVYTYYPPDAGAVTSFALVGENAYLSASLTAGGAAMFTVSLANLALPSVLDSFETAMTALDVTASAGTVYTTNYLRGVQGIAGLPFP